MALKIYNSLSRQKEEFKPLNPPAVKMYVCGPTVYDEPHIGHLRSAYVFDVVRKYLIYSGYHVTFVRNITDIDDKIIEKAKSLGPENLKEAVRKVSEKYEKEYREELVAFGIAVGQAGLIEPRATSHIQEMSNLITELVEKGCAYVSKDGDIYFDVQKFPDYGKLSGQKIEAMLEAVRIEPNEMKKNPLDFALWKKSKPDEPAWEGPVNAPPGRPGWHIECSAMSMKYLGESFDIHGGGLDLVFPHHENEIAQSEAVTGKPFARYWLHHGLVTREGQKMSKSLHNFLKSDVRSAPDRKEKRAEQYKVLFLSTHYRAPLDYTDDKMQMAKSILDYFYNFFDENEALFLGAGLAIVPELAVYKESLRKAMDDDFNTPKALSVMYEMVKFARDSGQNGIRRAIELELREFGARALGIFAVAAPRQSAWPLDEGSLLEDIKKRDKAKEKKDYAAADKIREEIRQKYRVELIDSKEGTHWRPIDR